MSINISDAIKQYNGRVFLSIENLCFERGLVYVLMGLNGSGKSTLLQCASGLDSFSEGEVLYDGKKLKDVDRTNIAVMPQKNYLFSGSVLDNLILGLKFRKYGKEEINQRLGKYKECFNIGTLLNKNAKKLSGGEQAKTALLRTAVSEAEFTFLDEPTASMDIESTLEAEKLIKGMSAKNRSVILVTHDLYQADRLGDYIIFLDKGNIIEKGDKYKVFNAPKHKLVKQILVRGEEHDKDRNLNYK